jgi:hypothetical protein
MIARLIHWQGAAGIAACLGLILLLALQKGETRRWRNESARQERLHEAARTAHAETIANYRAASAAARAADRANADRVAAEQRAITERTVHDFETRLADARARAQRLHVEARSAAADPRGSGAPAMPGLSASAEGIAEAAAQDGLSRPDALIATEQAIQLDALIEWVRLQHGVQLNRD